MPEVVELDYPMPHTELAYQPAPPFKEPVEELSYPEPGTSQANKQEESEQNEQDT